MIIIVIVVMFVKVSSSVHYISHTDIEAGCPKELLCFFDGHSVPINYNISISSMIDRNFRIFPIYMCFSLAYAINYSSKRFDLLCPRICMEVYAINFPIEFAESVHRYLKWPFSP